MKKLTFDEFVERARAVHGDEYNYEEDSYSKTKEKTWIVHRKCGHRFQQTPHNHLTGQGCPICCYKDRRNDYSLIDKSREKYGDRYEFPRLDKEYRNSHSKITVRCTLCGRIFKKITCDFITSPYGGCNCQKESEKYVTFDELKALYDKNEVVPYEGRRHRLNDKVEIVCKKHGIYEKYIRDLLDGNDLCQKCARSHNGDFRKLSFDEYKGRIVKKHPNLTILNREKYENLSTKLNFRCEKCGHTFQNSAYNVMAYLNVCRCCNSSRMEREIAEFLSKNGIKYETEKTFGWLKNKGSMYLDFYLPDYRAVIECQGIQHFKDVTFAKNESKIDEVRERDEKKRMLCEKHSLKIFYYANYHEDFPYKVYEDKKEMLKDIKLRKINT